MDKWITCMCLQRLPVRRQSVGRGLQLTPGMASSAVSRLLVLGLIVCCLHLSLNALLFNPSVIVFLCFPAAAFLWGRRQDGSQYPYTHSSTLGWICWSNPVRFLVFTLRSACFLPHDWFLLCCCTKFSTGRRRITIPIRSFRWPSTDQFLSLWPWPAALTRLDALPHVIEFERTIT